MTEEGPGVLVAGATGFIGSALCAHLREEGYRTVPLRRQTGTWDPVRGTLDPSLLKGFEFVINLCGENLADGRWNEKRKEAMRASRIESTRLLSVRLAEIGAAGKTLLNASAIGFYGNRGEEILTEDSPRGTGFLADLCGEWEEAACSAENAGCRTLLLRFGAVLSPAGGALRKMMRPFSAGLGGRLGSGRQYFSWISIVDAVRAVSHCMRQTSLKGPVNMVSPNPVTNLHLTESIAAHLHRPAFLRIPSTALRIAFGQMADEVLLSSTRAVPSRLLESGFLFEQPELSNVLKEGRI